MQWVERGGLDTGARVWVPMEGDRVGWVRAKVLRKEEAMDGTFTFWVQADNPVSRGGRNARLSLACRGGRNARSPLRGRSREALHGVRVAARRRWAVMWIKYVSPWAVPSAAPCRLGFGYHEGGLDDWDSQELWDSLWYVGLCAVRVSARAQESYRRRPAT
jgi:hypothetical protein